MNHLLPLNIWSDFFLFFSPDASEGHSVLQFIITIKNIPDGAIWRSVIHLKVCLFCPVPLKEKNDLVHPSVQGLIIHLKRQKWGMVCMYYMKSFHCLSHSNQDLQHLSTGQHSLHYGFYSILVLKIHNSLWKYKYKHTHTTAIKSIHYSH